MSKQLLLIAVGIIFMYLYIVLIPPLNKKGEGSGYVTKCFTQKPVIMKNRTLLFATLLVAALMTAAIEVISFSIGAPSNASGSPSNNGLTCLQCHQSNSNHMLNWITSTELSQGYVPGTQYNMKARAEQFGCTKFGFLVTIERFEGTKAGVPVVTDATRTQLKDTYYITHTQAGTSGQDSGVWTFIWHAPSAPMGTVSLYGAFLAANNDNLNTGDQVYVTSKDVFLFGTAGLAHLSASELNRMFVCPNPANTTLNLHLSNDVESAILNIMDISGRKVKEISWVMPKQMKVDVSSLPEGVYLLHLSWKDDYAVAKVVIRR